MVRIGLTILFCLFIGIFAVRERRQANGCGASGGLTINWALEAVGESVIIPCCNAHDICYDTCGRTQIQCDKAFRSCLNSACNSLRGNSFKWWIEFRRAACKLDGRTLYEIVNLSGTEAFNAAQIAHRCRG